MIIIEIIDYEPKEVWGVFQKEKASLRRNLKQIAEHPEIGVTVYVTCETDRGKEYPEIVVCLDDKEFYKEMALNESDCEQTVKKIYYEFLDEERMIDCLLKNDTKEENKWLEEDLEIEDRETDLDMAVKDVLEWYLNKPITEFVDKDRAEDIIDDVKNHIAEYLYLKWDISVYRPMILEDDDGEEFYDEFPYDCITFDEKDVKFYSQ